MCLTQIMTKFHRPLLKKKFFDGLFQGTHYWVTIEISQNFRFHKNIQFREIKCRYQTDWMPEGCHSVVPLPSAHCLLPSAQYLLPNVYCPLLNATATAHCPLPTPHCPLSRQLSTVQAVYIGCIFGSINFLTWRLLVKNNSDLHSVDRNSVSAADRQWTVGSRQRAVNNGQAVGSE